MERNCHVFPSTAGVVKQTQVLDGSDAAPTKGAFYMRLHTEMKGK